MLLLDSNIYNGKELDKRFGDPKPNVGSRAYPKCGVSRLSARVKISDSPKVQKYLIKKTKMKGQIYLIAYYCLPKEGIETGIIMSVTS